MSEYIVKLPISGAADEFFKIHEMPDMTLYGYPLTGKIVRCRDCKHYYEVDNYHPRGNYVMRCCNYFDTYNDEVDPDGFCKWGERREP